MNWYSLLPLAGVFVGSGLTLVGQGLTDRRAIRRDELTALRSAQAQDRAEWLILQRQTLVELQETLELVGNTWGHNGRNRLRESIAEEAANAVTKLYARLARLEDRQLAQDIHGWMEAQHASSAAMMSVMRSLQERLGEQLRATHNP
ncbi:hypothetical protein [Streptomyces globisporus]|uniref:hypothetical protein n=1 Tax=Streptomyces globisporus TaxID=1908 RepID=UPI0034605200|nr:hypothetical protein OG838_23705 [Streptomyces globisporus]